MTHAWAAGQFSQRGWPSQGSGHRLPERWEKGVLEGLLGPRQQELSLECPPASPNTPRLCPDSGCRHVRDSPSEGVSQEETKARCHLGPGDTVARPMEWWPEGASRGSVCFGNRALDTGLFLEARLRSSAQMTRPVPSLTRAGKAAGNAWLEGRQNWPLVAGWAESGEAAPALSQA